MPYPQLSAYLQQEMEVFAAEFVRDRIAALKRRRTNASGDLAKSLSYEVKAQTLSAATELLLAFEEHGRFIDMRRLQPAEGGADYIANIISWIEAKGLREKFVRGYMRNRKLKKVPERVMTYIAFGIARKRFNGRYRRTKWYNKFKSANITEMYDQIQAGLPDIVLEEMKRGFDPNQSTSSGTVLTSTRRPGSGRTRRFDYARDAKGRSREEGYTL